MTPSMKAAPGNILRALPQLRETAYRVSLQKNGITNICLHVQTRGAGWYLRVNRSAPGIDREREREVLRTIEPFDWAPEVAAWAPEYLLTRDHGQAWSLEYARSSTGIRIAAELLSSVHQVAADEVERVSPAQVLMSYARAGSSGRQREAANLAAQRR